MSHGFKILLLILLGFLALVVYRYRESHVWEVVKLLNSLETPTRSLPVDPVAHPVDRVLDPSGNLVAAVFTPPEPIPEPVAPEPALAQEGDRTDLRDVVYDFEDVPVDPGPAPEAESPTAGSSRPSVPEGALDGAAAPPGSPHGVARDVRPSDSGAPESEGNPGRPGSAPPDPPPARERKTEVSVETMEIDYIVQAGDKLWDIAEDHYGNGLDFKKILRWNDLDSPDLIRPGMTLKLRIPARPPAGQRRVSARDGREGRAAPDRGDRPRRPSDGDSRAGGRPAGTTRRWKTHVVEKGDSLARLARRYYQGDSESWRKIFEANRNIMKDPHQLAVGMELKVPVEGSTR